MTGGNKDSLTAADEPPRRAGVRDGRPAELKHATLQESAAGLSSLALLLLSGLYSIQRANDERQCTLLASTGRALGSEWHGGPVGLSKVEVPPSSDRSKASWVVEAALEYGWPSVPMSSMRSSDEAHVVDRYASEHTRGLRWKENGRDQAAEMDSPEQKSLPSSDMSGVGSK